jgi:hypothetical protein
MSSAPPMSPARPAAPATSAFVLGRRWRRAVLIVHVLAGGSWIGIDVMVAVLVWTGRFGADADVRGLAYRALAAFAVWPMLTAGLICLVSGLVLGLGTKWGLLRYWWVAVKLILNLVLCALIIVALEPGLAAVGAYGRELGSGAPAPAEISSLFFPPAVSLTALTVATVLSVVKPWGRIGRRSRPPRR